MSTLKPTAGPPTHGDVVLGAKVNVNGPPLCSQPKSPETLDKESHGVLFAMVYSHYVALPKPVSRDGSRLAGPSPPSNGGRSLRHNKKTGLTKMKHTGAQAHSPNANLTRAWYASEMGRKGKVEGTLEVGKERCGRANL